MTHRAARDRLAAALTDARMRTIALIADLERERWLGPKLPIVNPPLWELGHIGWFQEQWIVRHVAGRAPLRTDGDSLWDSARVAHDARWDLPLPTPDETIEYLGEVFGHVARCMADPAFVDASLYFVRLALFHEDMHDEALLSSRQTVGDPAPVAIDDEPVVAGALSGDAEIPGGTFPLGSSPRCEFLFDNEKWEHAVEVAPFRLARAPVTQGEFAEFVADGGYRRDEWWSTDGRAWRAAAGVERPAYWERASGGGWHRRHFDTLVPLEEHCPMIHVNWFEADAFCRARSRRLPTEAEWEFAATMDSRGRKWAYPWGDAVPLDRHARLGMNSTHRADVAAFPAGDSAFGCRQLIGNVWEWTASDFTPYPGFSPDPYREYSAPWFGTHKVLRGGCHATQPRMIRGAYRNFYTPDRRDVFAGFRTAAR